MPETQVTTQAAGLFQKAHGKIVMLNRLDTQLASLLGQRRRVQDELSGVQAEINEELGRVRNFSDELPGKILADITGYTGNGEEAHLDEAGRPVEA